MPIIRNPLAKPQNNPNRKRTKRKLFKINLSQLKTTSHKNNDIEIAKLHIKFRWRHGLTHWLNQHLLLLLNKKHIEFPDELSKTNIRCLQCCLITSNLESMVDGVNKILNGTTKATFDSICWFCLCLIKWPIPQIKDLLLYFKKTQLKFNIMKP